MLSDIWRGMVALADWRGWLRIAAGRPEVDVVFITNLRDEADRRRLRRFLADEQRCRVCLELTPQSTDRDRRVDDAVAGFHLLEDIEA